MRENDIIISYPGAPARRRLDVVGLTQELVRIPSNKGTKDVVSYLAQLAKEQGLHALQVPTLDARGRNRRAHPNLIVSATPDVMSPVFGEAHIDTVQPWDPKKSQFGPIDGTISNERIYGVGATDCKGSAAALFVAMTETGKGTVVFSADEEETLTGLPSAGAYLSKKYLRQAPQLIIAGGSNEGYALGTRGVLEGDLVVSGPSLHTSRPRDWTNVWEGQRRILNAVIEGTRVGDHPVLGRGNTEITYEQIGFFDGKRINRTANQTANRGEATFGIRLNDMPNAHGDLLTMHVIRDIIQQELALINEGQPDHQLELTDLQKRAHIAAAVSEPERTQWIVDYVQNKVGHPLNEWVYGERGLEQAIILAGAFSNPDLADQPRRPDLIIIGPGERALYHEPDEYVKIDDLRQYAEIYGDIFSHPNFN